MGKRTTSEPGVLRQPASEPTAVPWNRIKPIHWPLSSYYADLKARSYLRAFVRAGKSDAAKSERVRVIDHWLLEKKVSSIEIAEAIKNAARKPERQ